MAQMLNLRNQFNPNEQAKLAIYVQLHPDELFRRKTKTKTKQSKIQKLKIANLSTGILTILGLIK